MCFLISSLYSSIAIIVMLILAIVLHFRSLPTQWGSISQALIFHQVSGKFFVLSVKPNIIYQNRKMHKRSLVILNLLILTSNPPMKKFK